MTRRLNIVMPEETVRILDRAIPRGKRSEFITEAVKHYLTSKAKSSLAERVKQGAIANADRDLRMAGEWFELDEEAWTRSKRPRRAGK